MSSVIHCTLAFAICGSLLAISHCGSDSSCDGAACYPTKADGGDTNRDGSLGDTGAIVDPPKDCDVFADIKDAPTCVVNEFGLFVDGAAGSDTNPGTKEAPVKSLQGALTKLNGKPRVYICEGSYTDHVVIGSAVSLYGGFACGTWAYSGAKAVIAPSDRGVVVSVANATSNVVLSDLEITSKPAVDPGESSIAVLLATSTKVIARRLKVTAGKGITVKTGDSPADFATVAPNGKNGNDGAAPGLKTANAACTSVGGAGGASVGNPVGDNGQSGVVAVGTIFPAGADGKGGDKAQTCNSGASGNNGSFGLGGGAGQGAATPGVLSATGWLPSEGGNGLPGSDGQGGGGGARLGGTAVGGGGGAGGCAGVGGGKGQGGGASVAIAAFQAAVELQATTLITSDAGGGGGGGTGQKAQTKGTGGSVPDTSTACPGGSGGVGGSGGGGGGGAGGVSVGILYKGTAPKIEGTDVATADTHPAITLGSKGPKGGKGLKGPEAQSTFPISNPGVDGIDGADGSAKAVLLAP